VSEIIAGDDRVETRGVTSETVIRSRRERSQNDAGAPTVGGALDEKTLRRALTMHAKKYLCHTFA
jgi:hypothetical protein